MFRVLGVLAGGDFPAEMLAAWAASADRVVAADGGADRLRAAGVIPSTTIGDLDSLAQRSGLPEVIHDPDQDTSDVDKLLAWAAREGIDAVTLAGIEGDRPDHVLGTFASAARSPVAVRLVLRRGVAWVVRGEFETECEVGDLVSLMPITDCRGVCLEGVRWPLSDTELSPLRQVSLSNRATSSRVRVSIPTGAAALFLMSDRLESPHW